MNIIQLFSVVPHTRLTLYGEYCVWGIYYETSVGFYFGRMGRLASVGMIWYQSAPDDFFLSIGIRR